ncbi:hypothetical protein [Marilutibacter spongiae]|uniref:Uncharacterized protein n=1 Tax=Marilutibacter spongiae TaxID=2025720 RepID=A0A7W3Y5L1_9GAMM|nr:hypothetical protein [Lysobacter spongiae]MBB1060105.1 hypothetical protein [Lysobacter spongiae]
MPDTPDTGFADPPVPSPRRTPAEEGWRDAFLALELETPAGDGWPRLATRLPMAGRPIVVADPIPAVRPRDGRRRRRTVAAWAVAATLALAIGIAVPRLDAPAPSPGAPSTSAPSTLARADVSPPPVREDAAPIPIAATPTPLAVAATTPEATRAASLGSAAPDGGDAPAPHLATLATRATPPADARTAPTTHAFDRLYDESARLEAVVMLARDDGMSSATAAAMTTAIDARIGGIDVSLSEPGLLPDARLQLWQARVDALRDLAGLEFTQRLMAAQGRDDEATLVRVD